MLHISARVIVILGWTFAFSHYFAFAQSVDQLLNEANHALGKGGASSAPGPSENKSAKQKSTSKKRSTVDDKNAAQSTAQPPQSPTPQPDQPSPESTAAVRRVLEIDAMQQAEAQARAANGYDTSLMAAVHRMGSVYRLEKEEDVFRPQGQSTLLGAYGQLYLPAKQFHLGESRPFNFGAGLGLGVFSGSVKIQRTGVTSGLFSYEFLIIPIDLALRLETSLSERWRVRLHYGPASEIVSQNGHGQTDTTTIFAWGESAGLTLAWQAGDALRAQAFAARRGPLLLWKQREIAGWVFGLGVSYMFAG